MNSDAFFCSLSPLRIAELVRSAQRAACYAGPGVQLDLAQAMVERHADRYLHAPKAASCLSVDKRLSLFSHALEPTLGWELKHKGVANGDGSYSAELIGYAEIC